MIGSFGEAFRLIFSGDPTLYQIIAVTLRMTLTSSLLALLIGVPIGTWLGSARFRGRKILVVIDRALMGLPPVVCGLFCYLLFSGVGMVIAQVMLLCPMAIGMMESHANNIAPQIRENTRGLGIRRFRTLLLTMNESRYHIATTFLTLLGRALAEVGAVSIVGGAIMFKTNVMTTAIMDYTSMGNFKTALALGIILLFLSLALNIIVALVQGRFEK